MIDKRLLLALPAVMLLAACGGDTPATDGDAASGEVLEGTISDEMLPIDRVRSEPPLEDPEAFAEVHEKAAAQAPRGEADGEAQAEPGDTEAGEAEEAIVVPTLEPAE